MCCVRWLLGHFFRFLPDFVLYSWENMGNHAGVQMWNVPNLACRVILWNCAPTEHWKGSCSSFCENFQLLNFGVDRAANALQLQTNQHTYPTCIHPSMLFWSDSTTSGISFCIKTGSPWLLWVSSPRAFLYYKSICEKVSALKKSRLTRWSLCLYCHLDFCGDHLTQCPEKFGWIFCCTKKILLHQKM